jgi:hypothetical protein
VTDGMEHNNYRDGERLVEPGYDHVKQIGHGGYGHVYLFSRRLNEQQDYVAGKFIYRHMIGPADEPSTTAAYQRALEGLQNYRSLGVDSQYLLTIARWALIHSICCGFSTCGSGTKKATSAT